MRTTRTTQTVLPPACNCRQKSFAHVRMPRLLATATISERRLFRSRALDYVATIEGWRLFEEIW